MSRRHMHITSFLSDDQYQIDEFVQILRDLYGGFFDLVQPITAGPKTIAIAMRSKDLGDLSDELEMAHVAQHLSGILEHTITIASAWDGAPEAREHVWTIPGRGGGPRCPIKPRRL